VNEHAIFANAQAIIPIIVPSTQVTPSGMDLLAHDAEPSIALNADLSKEPRSNNQSSSTKMDLEYLTPNCHMSLDQPGNHPIDLNIDTTAQEQLLWDLSHTTDDELLTSTEALITPLTRDSSTPTPIDDLNVQDLLARTTKETTNKETVSANLTIQTRRLDQIIAKTTNNSTQIPNTGQTSQQRMEPLATQESNDLLQTSSSTQPRSNSQVIPNTPMKPKMFDTWNTRKTIIIEDLHDKSIQMGIITLTNLKTDKDPTEISQGILTNHLELQMNS
jgi:hypothetical protein